MAIVISITDPDLLPDLNWVIKSIPQKDKDKHPRKFVNHMIVQKSAHRTPYLLDPDLDFSGTFLSSSDGARIHACAIPDSIGLEDGLYTVIKAVKTMVMLQKLDMDLEVPLLDDLLLDMNLDAEPVNCSYDDLAKYRDLSLLITHTDMVFNFTYLLSLDGADWQCVQDPDKNRIMLWSDTRVAVIMALNVNK